MDDCSSSDEDVEHPLVHTGLWGISGLGTAIKNASRKVEVKAKKAAVKTKRALKRDESIIPISAMDSWREGNLKHNTPHYQKVRDQNRLREYRNGRRRTG
jgi:hypothetical protein